MKIKVFGWSLALLLVASLPIKSKVRVSPTDELCSEENNYIKNRLPKVKTGLESLLQKNIEGETPRIAFCFSGGGIRATLLTLGFLEKAEETGLLDCALYSSGLSGSSWALTSLLASEKSINDHLDCVTSNLHLGLCPPKSKELRRRIITTLANKFVRGYEVSWVDVYGVLLANMLMDKNDANRFTKTLSNYTSCCKEARFPLPICSAITVAGKPYQWLECTPFEAGFSHEGVYVPMNEFGAMFYKGSASALLEPSLGFMMGIFGSAFSISLQEVIERALNNPKEFNEEIKSIVSEMAKKRTLSKSLEKTLVPLLGRVINQFLEKWSSKIMQSTLGSKRISAASLPNFTYGMNGLKLASHKNLTYVDAGIDGNLALPPLLRSARAIDIIVIYDCADVGLNASSLKDAARFAGTYNLPLPFFDQNMFCCQKVSVFKDERKTEVPLIIYIPFTKNAGIADAGSCLQNSCATHNFTYSKIQAESIADWGRFALEDNLALIKNIIADVIKFG